MLRGRTTFVVLAVVALAAAVAGPSAATPESTSVGATRLTSLESLVLEQVNAVRATRGLEPLSLSRDLSRAAVAHSRSMATFGFFAHESRDGSSFSERLRRFYGPRSGTWTVGENLAVFGGPTPTADSIVAAWMGSPGHRANLLRVSFREAGVGIVHDPAAGGVFGDGPIWLVTLDVGRR